MPQAPGMFIQYSPSVASPQARSLSFRHLPAQVIEIIRIERLWLCRPCAVPVPPCPVPHPGTTLRWPLLPFPGGSQVVPRWFPGGSQVVPRWFPGGSQVVPRWFPGGPPDPLFSVVVRAAAANVNPHTRLSHMTKTPPFLGY